MKLEQRQEALELQLSQQIQEQSPEEIEILDGVEQLLRECQDLLESSNKTNESDPIWNNDEEHETLAA